MMEKFGDLSLLKIKGVSRVEWVGIFFGRRRIENKKGSIVVFRWVNDVRDSSWEI